jgi:hypothetical protein
MEDAKFDAKLAEAEPKENGENHSTTVLGQFLNGKAVPAERGLPSNPADGGGQKRALPRHSSAPLLSPTRESSPGRHLGRQAPNINGGALIIQKRTTAGAWNRFADGGVHEDDRLRALPGSRRPAGFDGHITATALHQPQSASVTPIKPTRNSPTVARKTKVIGKGRRQCTDTFGSRERVDGDPAMTLIDLNEPLPLYSTSGNADGDNADGAITSSLLQTITPTNARRVDGEKNPAPVRSNTMNDLWNIDVGHNDSSGPQSHSKTTAGNLIDLVDFDTLENPPSPLGEHGNNTIPQPSLKKRNRKLPKQASLIDLD